MAWVTAQLALSKLREGYDQTDIAAQFGVSRQYINELLQQSGAYESRRNKISEIMPWEVRRPHTDTAIHRTLRAHAEYMLYGTEDMAERRRKRLGGLYRRLELNNSVIEYHPGIPPNKYYSGGGFAQRDREEQDADLIIRVNDFSRVKGILDYWRFPPVRP